MIASRVSCGVVEIQISFAILPLSCRGPLAGAADEADQNRTSPVPGAPNRSAGPRAGQDKCRQGRANLIPWASPGSTLARRGLPKKSLLVLGLSTRREFVTTPTRLWGGVVPRLCVFIPDPARPGDPPGRLL